MSLNTNITNLQKILDKVNNLPEANSGIELPSLSNEGLADDLVVGKELIDSSGNIVVGTNPYEKVATDNAIANEANLIAQIQSALKGKGAGSAPENKGTCPFVILNFSVSPWTVGGNPEFEICHLSYYSNGELKRIAGDYNVSTDRIILNDGDTYTFYDVDINFPITLAVYSIPHDPYIENYSDNIINYNGIHSFDPRIIILAVTDTNPATVTIEQ